MARTPAYHTVYQAIKKQIREKKYPVGSLLPTEGELEQEFSVSRTTIRRAIGLLASDGYIKVTQGRGTEVLDRSTFQNLNHISSITESLTTKGYTVTSREMDIRKVRVTGQAAKMLQLNEGDEAYLVQRLQYADDVPIALMTNYLRVEQVPGLERFAGCFSGLYAYLEKQYGIVIKEATEYLSATTADFCEAKLLHVDVGAPLLCSRRSSSTEAGVFEYSVNKIVAEHYEYCVHLKGR
ncbi:MAG: GntR family transcriptional regulator [Clostridia bacterium]|nr:GntR family transcriptional regulator [Clostridia bacterium]